MARASGRPVPAWADAWLRTSGPDTLTPEVTDTADGWTLRLTHTGGRPHRLLLGTYGTTGTGDAERATPGARHDIELAASDAPATATASVTEHAFPGPRPALLVVNDGDLTYAKVRLDPASWDTARRTLSTLPDALTRTVVWNAARDMVRDGELDPAAYLETAARHLKDEPSTAIVQGVLAFARGRIADLFLAPERRPAALETLSGLARRLLGPDVTDPARRLIAARAAIGSATAPDELRAWWKAGTVPGGPALDPELRWNVLHRLAVLGATTEAEIRAEADRDPTATGEESAARCRAALPDPAAKEAAWNAMFDPADRLSNYLFIATAEGFWHPEQRDVLAPYVARYFPAATALAARRGHSLAMAVGRWAFPRGFTEPETLRLGEECLAAGGPDGPTPALRRVLADQLDDLRRALRVISR